MATEKFYADLPDFHPGEILREEYLAPLGLSAGGLAKRLGVPRTRIERLIAEETSLTVDTALRLARFFGTSPELWMSMQMGYDFKRAQVEKAEALNAIVPLEAA
jgi:antitoxin HigA-1